MGCIRSQHGEVRTGKKKRSEFSCLFLLFLLFPLSPKLMGCHHPGSGYIVASTDNLLSWFLSWLHTSKGMPQILFFINILFSFLFVCLSVYLSICSFICLFLMLILCALAYCLQVHLCEGVRTVELEIETVLSCHVGCGIKLRSSGRVNSALDH